MSVLKSRGNGLFIESFRTPGERERALKDKRTEEVLKENESLKKRLSEIEKKLGIESGEEEGK